MDGGRSFRRIEERNGPTFLIDRMFCRPAGEFRRSGPRGGGQAGDEHRSRWLPPAIAHIRGSEKSSTHWGAWRATGSAARHRDGGSRRLYPECGQDGRCRRHHQRARCHAASCCPVPRPDGVFCFNDPTAMGALKAILDSGLRVSARHRRDRLRQRAPRGILGALSSVDQDSAGMGDRRHVGARLWNPRRETPSKTLLLPPKASCARESTRRQA